MVNLLKRFVVEEEGLELLEYAILAVVLGAALIGIYQGLRDQISAAVTTTTQGLSSESGS